MNVPSMLVVKPLNFFRQLKSEMLRKTGKVPTKLRIRQNVFNSLMENQDVLDRIRYVNCFKGELTKELLAYVLGFEEIEIIAGVELTFDF